MYVLAHIIIQFTIRTKTSMQISDKYTKGTDRSLITVVLAPVVKLPRVLFMTPLKIY